MYRNAKTSCLYVQFLSIQTHTDTTYRIKMRSRPPSTVVAFRFAKGQAVCRKIPYAKRLQRRSKEAKESPAKVHL